MGEARRRAQTQPPPACNEVEGEPCTNRGWHNWRPLVQDGGTLWVCSTCGYRPAKPPPGAETE